ncbi:MMPL family transporter [Lapillicoccus sp.]|uniref:MMPL family transporter n=1 Tax=Lapillicoccus sp. TaxID=1909287 RepID=UPI0039831719
MPDSVPTRVTRLARLGATSARHPWRFIATWAVLSVVAFAVAVGGVTGESLFERLQSGSPSGPGEARAGSDLLSRSEPTLETLMLQVRGADLVSPDGQRAAAAVQAAAATATLATIPGVGSVTSPLLLPEGVTNPQSVPLLSGGTPTAGGFITVAQFRPGLTKTEQAAADAAIRSSFDGIVAALPGATGEVGGVTPLVDAITSQVETDLRAGEGIALPFSFILMVFVFGGFVAAGMPIIGAVTAIGGALASLFAFSHVISLDASVVNVVTLLGLGLSIDYGLLTVSRFREELAVIGAADHDHRRHRFSREEVVTATSRTVATAGRTVLFSGLTVAIALAGLLIFDAEIMRAIGAAGVSVVLVALVVDLTLIPALCAVGARRLVTRGRGDAPDRGVFSRLASIVQARPVTIIVVTLAALTALAWPATSMRLTSSGAGLLPVTSPERVFFERLARDYPQLSAPNVTVVARAPLSEAQAWANSTVAALPGVQQAMARAVTPDLSAVAIRVSGGQEGPQTEDVITAIRSDRPAFETFVTGPAADQRDFLSGMAVRAPYAAGLVVLGTFVLLFLMTGSVVIPLKALLLNVVSLGAALGVLVLVFQDGHLEGLVDFTSVGAIESLIPFLALAFGFGLSMDYEVFLLARIAELYRQGLPNDQSVALGLQRSGRIITSAALLVMIVFAGFAAGKLLVIKEIGVALVAAVALDATLVRMLLVPATMTLLGRWNWWAPPPLRRWHERHGIAE